MIEELHLKNCQSHKDSILKFSPGLNIITGDTDSGKSAIIRGLDKICYNSMTSKELISHWSKSLFISIVVDNHKLELSNREVVSLSIEMEPDSPLQLVIRKNITIDEFEKMTHSLYHNAITLKAENKKDD